MDGEAEERKLRRIYSEIINGFSVTRYLKKDVYIRHSGTLNNLELDYLYTQYYEDAVSKGYPTEEERVASLKKDGIWNEALINEIDYLKLSMKSLFVAKRKAFRKSDIDSINSQIKEQESLLVEKLTKKELVVGSTAEKFSRRKVDAFFISESFYVDRNLKNLVFTNDEFDNLESNELDEVYNVYYNSTNNLNELNIKKIALKDFFLNVFMLAENIYQFFGKPLAELTHYQVQLCAYGNFFKNILSSDPKPPDDISSDPEKIEDWYFGRANAEEELKRLGKDGEDGSLVGMTKEDREFLGYNQEEQIPMRERIKDAGGELSMEELMKLDNV